MARNSLKILLVIAAATLSGCGKSAVDEMTASKRSWSNDGFKGYILDVTSKGDALTLRKIKINRGNCKFDFSPSAMRFGETISLPLMCNPIEVEIETDHGTQTFSWND